MTPSGGVAPPVVILVRPQLGENIGAAARAMMNCGLHDMRIVAPRDGWPNPAALPMAAGGASIIENATVHDSIADAAHDLTFLAALSARRRDMPVRGTDPRRVIPDILAHGGKAGLMFGPEQSGLDNEDVVRADCLVTADLNPDYPSLNLAQAVLMMAWEWRVAALPRMAPPHHRWTRSRPPFRNVTGSMNVWRPNLMKAAFSSRRKWRRR